MNHRDQLADIIERELRGETVDYAQELRLQALLVAKAGQDHVAETLDRERKADDELGNR